MGADAPRAHQPDTEPSKLPRTRRLFFALWPDASTREGLAAFLAALPRGDGRDMRAANLHLTLAFLGDCEEVLLPCLEAVGASLRGRSFVLTFDRLGRFPRARVLWLGVSEPPAALFELQERLSNLLASHCRLPKEHRPFVPHLTLRRNVHHPCLWPKDSPPIVWPVGEVALIESLPEPEGVIYRPIRTWPLTETPSSA